MTSVDSTSDDRPASSGGVSSASTGSDPRPGGPAPSGFSAWLTALLSLIGKLDRVWLALAALLAILALADPGQAGESVLFMTDSFLWIAPFLLLSVFLAAWLKAAGVDRLVGRLGARAPAVRKASAAPGIMPMLISSPTRGIAVYTRSCHASYNSKFPELSNKLGKKTDFSMPAARTQAHRRRDSILPSDTPPRCP